MRLGFVGMATPTTARTLRPIASGLMPRPNDIPENRKRAKDRATYLGTMDHPDNTTVRSAVGFVGDACWFIGGG
jgi:hypothetical protein